VVCSALDFPSHPEIIKEHLTEISHALVISARHPLARRKEPLPSALLKFPWVTLTNNLVGNARVNSFFSANGLRPPWVAVETNSTSNLLALVATGHYIANIPNLMLPMAEALGLRLLSMHGTLWDAPAGIAYRSTTVPVPTINAFCALIRSHFTAPAPRAGARA
jgi:DNA-binding transcriptional LysR family regulator